MMLKISLNHLVRYLARGGAKEPSRPKMPLPVPFFELRKLFEKLRRAASFDSPHYLARSHRRRSRHENVNMILAHDSADYSNFERLARLSHQFSDSKRHVAFQNLIAKFRNPYEMILDIKNRVASVSVVHSPKTSFRASGLPYFE